ncbi:MAG: PVC-type heme-binding CxxCH protein, partial [Verrucomicrobiales bacterium]
MKPSTLALILSSLPALNFAAELPAPEKDERIVMIGNGLGERMIDHGHFETELQLRFPQNQLYIRNMCRMGDTASFRPHPSRNSQWAFPGAEKFRPEYKVHKGNGHHPTPDEWLDTVDADTILAFFGYNESFDGPNGLDAFKNELDAFITHTLAQKYNGESAPKLALVSPIAFEDLSASKDLPNGQKENENLALYTAAMQEIAEKRGIPFIDLFTPTKKLLAEGKSLTRNGFLPDDEGYQTLAPLLANALYGPAKTDNPHRAQVRDAVLEKNWFWFNDYRMLNGVHVDGRRYKPFGNVNYPDEIKKIRQMTELRDHAVWRALAGEASDLATADQEKTLPLPSIESNYKPSNKNGNPEYLDGEKAIEKMTLPEGYKVELFASEDQFPNLANPVQMSFDNKGRLWVATMPSYPHYKPGDQRPDDKILIYEDTDNDGKADKETVFADGLHVPTGFELAPEGVYVAQEPHLMIFRDTDGDDKADEHEILLTGFDTHDTHHAIGAFAADPSGAFMMCEGVFLHSNVETPYGPVRGVDGGFYRYNPARGHLERSSQLPIPNPWGFAFDDWGQDFFLHTSGTTVNWHMPSSLKTPYGHKNNLTKDLAPEGHKVRPTSGLEFLSSRHFPDEVQ